ncbi:hypothetical protein M2322_004143 [Rhodoblastus acidophilus]|nr:hypothetical protein [Rhodoblastus acidophilus]
MLAQVADILAHLIFPGFALALSACAFIGALSKTAE